MDAVTLDILQEFNRLSAIPRPSGGEAQIAAYIADALAALGLHPEMDGAHNLRCLLPPSPGREHEAGLILQAHTDMVCAADPAGDYRPGLDPITPVPDGEWLRSDGRSSLGADNGMAVALMLWLAKAQPVPHGPVLLLFTACEERGLLGARALSPAWLTGFRYCINLDAFRGDAAIFASAGGLRQSWSRPVRPVPCRKKHGFTVTLSGLTGGHSGFDIHRGRLNALDALLRFVLPAPWEIGFLTGGSDYNAIPTSASAWVATDDADGLCSRVDAWRQGLLAAHRQTDPALTVTAERCPPPAEVWPEDTRQALGAFFTVLPQGVQRMREDCLDAVADSGNPAVLTQTAGVLTLRHFSRCARQETLEQRRREEELLAAEHGFTLVESSGYAPWNGAPDSPLLHRVTAVMEAETGQTPTLAALHVGLECSLLLEKAPRLTGVSLGFDIADAHSPSERVRLASIPRLARIICRLLAEGIEEETV